MLLFYYSAAKEVKNAENARQIAERANMVSSIDYIYCMMFGDVCGYC